jgi:hypothetical protein
MLIHTISNIECLVFGCPFCLRVSLFNLTAEIINYFSATLTIFSLVLFALVIDMRVEMLLDWMLFAAILDAIFVFATSIFALTLQNCDALLTEYQHDQIVELPDTIEQEDGRKKQRSKSLLYSQLAVDDFMNGARV